MAVTWPSTVTLPVHCESVASPALSRIAPLGPPPSACSEAPRPTVRFRPAIAVIEPPGNVPLPDALSESPAAPASNSTSRRAESVTSPPGPPPVSEPTALMLTLAPGVNSTSWLFPMLRTPPPVAALTSSLALTTTSMSLSFSLRSISPASPVSALTSRLALTVSFAAASTPIVPPEPAVRVVLPCAAALSCAATVMVPETGESVLRSTSPLSPPGAPSTVMPTPPVRRMTISGPWRASMLTNPPSPPTPPTPPVPPDASRIPSTSIVPPPTSIVPPLPPVSGAPMACTFEPTLKATVSAPSKSIVPPSKPPAAETGAADGVKTRLFAADRRSVPPMPVSPPSRETGIPIVIESLRDAMSIVPPAPPESVALAETRLP